MAYSQLLDADRSILAWEWLRRDPAYRAAAGRAFAAGISGSRNGHGERPEQWGLHAFELPGLAAPAARPVWCARVYPYVLGVEADLLHGGDAFDLGRLGAMSTLVRGADGCEHLLICDGLRSIRIDVLAGTLAAGPVELQFRITGLASAERPALTLRRLLALWRRGHFCRSLHLRETRARRWILLLRAHDALGAGANQREIACRLLRSEAGEPRWREHSASVRSQAQRLVRGARNMAAGGYLELLG